MAIRAEPSYSLADQLFNAETVGTFAEAVANAWPKFDQAQFTQASLAAFPDLELKARIRHLVDRMDEQLPEDFDQAVVFTVQLQADLGSFIQLHFHQKAADAVGNCALSRGRRLDQLLF